MSTQSGFVGRFSHRESDMFVGWKESMRLPSWTTCSKMSVNNSAGRSRMDMPLVDHSTFWLGYKPVRRQELKEGEVFKQEKPGG